MQRSFQNLLYSLPLCFKRGPYLKYKKFPETVDKVIILLRNYANHDMNEIAQKTGFKLRTLYDWKAKLKKDSNYNPLNPQVRLTARYLQKKKMV